VLLCLAIYISAWTGICAAGRLWKAVQGDGSFCDVKISPGPCKSSCGGRGGRGGRGDQGVIASLVPVSHGGTTVFRAETPSSSIPFHRDELEGRQRTNCGDQRLSSSISRSRRISNARRDPAAWWRQEGRQRHPAPMFTYLHDLILPLLSASGQEIT
jgi:hypothetical protein